MHLSPDIQYSLKNLVDNNGDIIGEEWQIKEQEYLALDVMKNFLGYSITKNNKKFILTELELYYGGIGDMAHDWYRRNFQHKYENIKKSRTSNETAKYQTMKGPIFYFNRMGGGKHKRCDIVIGADGVAVSFLIRSIFILDSHLHISGPNNSINAIGLIDDDLGKIVELEDTRSWILNKGFQYQIPRKRVISGKACGFSSGCIHDQKLWNLSIDNRIK